MSSSSQALLLEEVAIKLAFSLKEELRLQNEWSNKLDLVKILYNVAPSRDQLKKAGKEGPRENLLVGVANKNEEERRYFCICHGEFSLSSGMDLEHAFPCVKTSYRQERLLAYLNNEAHNDFTNVFLQQPAIEEYLRRDSDGIVKGSGYFYKSCYNAIDNLYLLCHACNIRKKDSDPIEWLGEQKKFFGKFFVREIESLGGYHEGILFDRIYELPKIKESDILTWDDGQKIILRSAPSQGIGEFIKKWFFSKFSKVQEGQTIIYDDIVSHVHKLFDKIVRLIFETEKENKIQKMYKRLIEEITMLSVYQKSFMGFHLEQISSGSDGSQEDNTGFKQELQYVENLGNQAGVSRSSIRKIRGLVKNSYQDKELGIRIKHYCQALRDEDPKIDWLKVFLEFQTVIEQQRLLPREKWRSEEEIKERLKELVIEHSTLLKTQQEVQQERKEKEEARQEVQQERKEKEEAQQEAEQARQRAEQEYQRAERERQEKEQERQRREEAEQKLAELMGKIKSLEEGQQEASPKNSALSPTPGVLSEASNDERSPGPAAASQQDIKLSSYSALSVVFSAGEKRSSDDAGLDENAATKRRKEF